MILVLDNIRSVYNVGSLFRTADAAGVSEILLCGVTPDPIDRFGRARADLAKVALGAEEGVPWRHIPTTRDVIAELQKQGLTVVALEQSQGSHDYRKVAEGLDFAKTTLVVGEETQGLSQEILDMVDVIAEIPMSGEKESLNVSVATGIALFRFRDM